MNRYRWKRTGRFYCYMVTRHNLPSVNTPTSQRKWLKRLKSSQDCPTASGVSREKHLSILCFTSCQEQFKIKELCGWPVRSEAMGAAALIFPFYPITNILDNIKQIPCFLLYSSPQPLSPSTILYILLLQLFNYLLHPTRM